MIKAVIFDMDGVLVDNSKMHVKAFDIWTKRHNLKKEKVDTWKLFGMGNKDIFRMLYNIPMTDEEVERYGEEKEEIYREILEKEIKPVDGLIDFLKDLKKNNIICAVGSSGIKKNVDMVLDKCSIRDYFKAIVNGDMLTNAKPDPEVYNKCSQALGIKPEECLVCEDAPAGIEAARRAGMKVLVLATSFKKEQHNDYDLISDTFTGINYNTIKDL